jgi:hypothetical protein
MKRSKMIDEMSCEIYAFAAAYPQYPLEKINELAERILKLQEKLGMEPPLNENWMSLDECKEYYGKDFDSSNGQPRKNIYRWDSEDE